MNTPWIENSDGTLSCTQCGASSFRPGHHCSCSAGDSPGVKPVDLPSLADTQLAGDSAGESLRHLSALPTMQEAFQSLLETRTLLRRLHRRVKQRTPRDKLIDGVNVRVADIHQRDVDELKVLEVISKHDQKIYEASKDRELPELVEEMRRFNAEAKRRESRLARDPGVQ